MGAKLDEVKSNLGSRGWKLISNTYKNLKTPLQMECPNGHLQEQTYEKWRKECRCPMCEALPNTGGAYRILALDAATIITGWAIYDNRQLKASGIFKLNSNDELTTRINDVKLWLSQMIDNWSPNAVCIENIQLQKDKNSNMQRVDTFQKLARLQGVLLDLLYEKNIHSDLVFSETWRHVCGIGGVKREERKKITQEKVLAWYNKECSEDEADAICIGKYYSMQPHPNKAIWGEEMI